MKDRVWINFKELRAKLQFPDVLTHYRVEVRKKGEQHQGPCPLPGHSGSKTAPAFSANLSRGIFHCFGCGAKGNVLEFAALMSGVDVKDGVALRKVALELQNRFYPGGSSSGTESVTGESGSTSTAAPDSKVLVNEPLDFVLKDLDVEHPYLLQRGFTRDTIEYFGLGFCRRGMLNGRIAIPIRDDSGRLVGYSGRLVDDSTATKENPRYCFPTARERKGTRHEFDRTLLLYNSHSAQNSESKDDLIIVQGFPSVWWLHQNGHKRVVGLLSDELRGEQEEILFTLVKPLGRIQVMPDGGKGGSLLAQGLLRIISAHRYVRWIKLGAEERPSDLSPDKLKQRLTQ